MKSVNTYKIKSSQVSKPFLRLTKVNQNDILMMNLAKPQSPQSLYFLQTKSLVVLYNIENCM